MLFEQDSTTSNAPQQRTTAALIQQSKRAVRDTRVAVDRLEMIVKESETLCAQSLEIILESHLAKCQTPNSELSKLPTRP